MRGERTQSEFGRRACVRLSGAANLSVSLWCHSCFDLFSSFFLSIQHPLMHLNDILNSVRQGYGSSQ